MKVLLGIGDGTGATAALERTVSRAREAGDDLTIAVLEGAIDDADPDEIAREARERASAAGIDAAVRRVAGRPGSRLVEIAEDEGFDELVIGGGEQSPMGKIEFGPITEFVLLNSHVTVTLVR